MICLLPHLCGDRAIQGCRLCDPSGEQRAWYQTWLEESKKDDKKLITLQEFDHE